MRKDLQALARVLRVAINEAQIIQDASPLGMGRILASLWSASDELELLDAKTTRGPDFVRGRPPRKPIEA